MGKANKLKLQKQTLHPYAKHSAQKDDRQVSLQKTTKIAKSSPPTIPFSPTDRILLVGEGDFSFAHSLLTVHKCSFLIATSYDRASVIASKYAGATSHIRPLEAEEDCKVIYGVDATKLGRSGAPDGGGKVVKKGAFDRIVFNFPHVGGLTKDVNRQVRYNQGQESMSSRIEDRLTVISRTSRGLFQICGPPAGACGINHCHYLRGPAVRFVEC